MNNISLITNCFGCGVCSIACPPKIIEIETNKYGFYQPRLIDISKCNDCGLCISVCAFSFTELAHKERNSNSGYAAWSNNTSIRYNSASGGIGFELGKLLIEKGYNACGVRYNVKEKRAEHFITRDIDDYKASLGSKYIQSYTIDAFSQFRKGEKYFVAGTPCQIDSLRRLIRLRKVEDNFLLMDFFCHGVPSSHLWHNYLSFIEKKIGTVNEVKWRDKKYGWFNSYLISANKCNFLSSSDKNNMFFSFFLGSSCLSKACYLNCKYKMLNSSADIRVGDFWGTKYRNEDKGVSALIVNTEKGKKIVENFSNSITLIPEDIHIILDGQKKESPPIPPIYHLLNYLLLLKIDIRIIFILNQLINRILNRVKFLKNQHNDR